MIFFDENAPINIDEIYDKQISKIDKLSSSSYIYEEELNQNNIFRPAEKPQSSKPSYELNSLYKIETRAHAFYRVLGLPIPNGDGTKFFNPGFDPDVTQDVKKLDIANSYLKCKTYKDNNIYQEMFGRTNNTLDVFTKTDITASVLLLSSINKRLFADSIKNGNVDPLNITMEDIKYTVDMTDAEGKSYIKDYTYIKETPNLPDGLAETRHRFILPLIPDPKICFCVSESSQVYAPFITIKGADSEPDFKFPAAGLDKIFQERFSKSKTDVNLTDTEKEIKETISIFPELLKKNKFSQADIDTINKSSNNFLNDKKINKFYFNFIKYSKDLLKALKQLMVSAKDAQTKSNILPLTNKYGPEKNISSKPIYAKDPRNKEIEKKIILETILNIANSIGNLYPTPTNQASPVINPKNVVDDINTPAKDPNEDIKKQKSIDIYKLERAAYIEIMQNSIKYIEYLMGEFSGFGIIDMYVIISALYLIDGGALASFLDDAAYERAKQKEFNIDLPERSVTVIEAYKKLTETIRTLYLTLDTLFLAI